jgi:pimeloyl-ACP methyl ester carboxylesterase
MEDGGHPIMKLPAFVLNCLQNTLSKSFVKLALCEDCDPDLRERCLQQNNANDIYFAKATHRHHKWATSEDVRLLQNIPTLVVHGTEDGILSPQCSEEIVKEIPNSQLRLISKASHLVMLEQPTEMANAVADFLTKDVLKRQVY